MDFILWNIFLPKTSILLSYLIYIIGLRGTWRQLSKGSIPTKLFKFSEPPVSAVFTSISIIFRWYLTWQCPVNRPLLDLPTQYSLGNKHKIQSVPTCLSPPQYLDWFLLDCSTDQTETKPDQCPYQRTSGYKYLDKLFNVFPGWRFCY